MAKRIAGSDLVGQKTEIGLANNVPGQLARDVGGASRSLHQIFAPTIERLQEKEGRRIARQGIVDGQKNRLDPKLLYNPSFKGKAYTKSAVTAYTKSLELETRQEINNIFEENPNNSARANELITNYVQGRIDGMPPQLQERIGEMYKLQSTISASPKIAGIRRKENATRLQKAEAENVALETEVAKGLPGIGIGIGSSDPVEARGAVLAMIQERSRIESAYDSQIVGELANGGADLAFDPADKQTALAKFDTVVGRNMIEQRFNDADDKRAYYRDFRNQKLEDTYVLKDDGGNVIADLRPSPATRRRLDASMKQAINAENTLLTKQKAAVKKGVDGYVDAVTNNRPVSPDEETALLQSADQFGSQDQQERLENWFNFKPEYENLRRGSLADIDRYIIDMEGEIDQAEAEGKFVSKGMIERRDIVVKLRSEKARLLDADPIAAGIVYDGQQDIGPLDSPQKMQAQTLNARETAEKYNKDLQILSKNNLERFNRIWESRELRGRDILRLLSSFDGFGPDKRQVITELAPKNPSLAHIAVLMSNGAGDTASDAADGLAMIRTGQAEFTGERKTTAGDEAAILGNAYRMNHKARNAVIATAQAIYVSRVGGNTDGGAVFDEELYKQALKEASGEQEGPNGKTGGIIKMGPGLFGGSHSVVVPHDVSQEEFKKAMEKGFTAKDLAEGGLNGGAIRPRAIGGAETIDTREALEEYGIPIPVGDGLYIWGRKLGNGEIEFLQGNTDLEHEHPAIREGYYVTDYRAASTSKERRKLRAAFEEKEKETEKQANLKEKLKDIDSPVDIAKDATIAAGDILQDLGDKLGDFGDQVFEGIFGGEKKKDLDQERKALQKEEKQYYKKHPQSTLKLTPTEWTTPFGMPVYTDQHGQRHSESSETIQFSNGKWGAVPMIWPDPETGEARYFTPQETQALIEANNYKNPVSGEKIALFGSEPEATDSAIDRDMILRDKKHPWNQPADQPGLLDDLKEKGSDVKDFAGRSGEELGEDILDGLGAITKGIIAVGDEIQNGIKTIKEFSDENPKESEQLSKLVTKKSRKLSNGESVNVFASSVAPMIVTKGSVEGLPPVGNITAALVEIESSFKVGQVSKQGATGPAQIMPGTAQDIADRSNLGWKAEEILNDPEKNIMAGMWYLFEDLLPKFSGPDRLKLAMAAYHAGAGGVNKARAKSAHKNDYDSVEANLGQKTQDYVKKFTKALKGNL